MGRTACETMGHVVERQQHRQERRSLVVENGALSSHLGQQHLVVRLDRPGVLQAAKRPDPDVLRLCTMGTALPDDGGIRSGLTLDRPPCGTS